MVLGHGTLRRPAFVADLALVSLLPVPVSIPGVLLPHHLPIPIARAARKGGPHDTLGVEITINNRK
jgi:hypothetical protein